MIELTKKLDKAIQKQINAVPYDKNLLDKYYPQKYEKLMHMLPPQKATTVIHEQSYMLYGKGTKQARKIFKKVEYTEGEKQAIANLKHLLKVYKIEMPKYWFESDYLKAVYQGKLSNYAEMIQKLLLQINWRNQEEMQMMKDENEISMQMLKSGFFYQFGRDRQYRPVLYFQLSPVMKYLKDKKCTCFDMQKSLTFLCNEVRHNMFIDYHIENWILIIDVDNMSFFGFPFKYLKSIFEVCDVAYPGCLEKIVIWNPSFSLNSVWKIVESILDPIVAAKVMFQKVKKSEKLHTLISPDQIEQKYGGTAPNLTSYWPPIETMPNEEKMRIEESSRQKLLEFFNQSTENNNPAEATIILQKQVNEDVIQKQEEQLEKVKESDDNFEEAKLNEINDENQHDEIKIREEQYVESGNYERVDTENNSQQQQPESLEQVFQQESDVFVEQHYRQEKNLESKNVDLDESFNTYEEQQQKIVKQKQNNLNAQFKNQENNNDDIQNNFKFKPTPEIVYDDMHLQKYNNSLTCCNKQSNCLIF